MLSLSGLSVENLVRILIYAFMKKEEETEHWRTKFHDKHEAYIDAINEVELCKETVGKELSTKGVATTKQSFES